MTKGRVHLTRPGQSLDSLAPREKIKKSGLLPRRIEAPVLIDEKVGSKGTRQKEKKSKMIELRYGTRNN